jgi:hypothetical protein
MERVTLATEWWADAEGNPVPFGSPLGVSVLYGIGASVPASVAAKLPSLADSLKAIEQAQTEDKAAQPASNKAIRAPRARK